MNEPDEVESHPVEESTNCKSSEELRVATPVYDGSLHRAIAMALVVQQMGARPA